MSEVQTMTRDNVRELYASGWNGGQSPEDEESVEWEIWAAGDNDREDDDYQADFPLGFDQRFELFMEWEFCDMDAELDE